MCVSVCVCFHQEIKTYLKLMFCTEIKNRDKTFVFLDNFFFCFCFGMQVNLIVEW